MHRPGRRFLIAAVSSLLVGGCGGSDKQEEPEGSASSPEAQPTTYAQKILGALDRGSVEKTRSDMQAISTALAAYSTTAGEFPDAADLAGLKARLVPTFIRVLPRRDAWGSTFVYEPSSDGWTLTAPGADGQAGTGDDVVLSDGGWTKLPDGYREM